MVFPHNDKFKECKTEIRMWALLVKALKINTFYFLLIFVPLLLYLFVC